MAIESRGRDTVVAGVLSLGVGLAFVLGPSGARSGPSVCPFLALTGAPCPLCGSVRAWSDLAHGEVVSAMHMNPTGILTLAAAVLITVALVVALVRRASTDVVWRRARPWLLALVGVVSTVGVVRAGGVMLDLWTWLG